MAIELEVWKWNKQYIAERTCCKKNFILDYEVGERLRCGEDVEINYNDLEMI